MQAESLWHSHSRGKIFVRYTCNCLRSDVTEQQIVLLKYPARLLVSRTPRATHTRCIDVSGVDMKCRMTTRMQPTPTRNVPPQCKLAQAACLWKRRTILAAAAAPTSRSFVCDHFANAHSAVVVREKGQTVAQTPPLHYFAVIIIGMNIAARFIAELSAFVRTLITLLCFAGIAMCI